MAKPKSIPLPSFWDCYRVLPEDIRKLADKQFDLFLQNRHHPSLGFAKKGGVYTVDIGRSCRAIARKKGDDYYWFWVGSHEAYNNLLKRTR